MDRAICSTTAAQTLAIDRDLMPGQFRQARLHPRTERLREGVAINPSDDYGNLLAQIASLLHLNWIYESPRMAAVDEDENKNVGPVVAPPEDEIEALYRLARLGNMQDILQWASRLDALDERYRPFANQLRTLAKGYQSKAILSLAKRYMEIKEVS